MALTSPARGDDARRQQQAERQEVPRIAPVRHRAHQELRHAVGDRQPRQRRAERGLRVLRVLLQDVRNRERQVVADQVERRVADEDARRRPAGAAAGTRDRPGRRGSRSAAGADLRNPIMGAQSSTVTGGRVACDAGLGGSPGATPAPEEPPPAPVYRRAAHAAGRRRRRRRAEERAARRRRAPTPPRSPSSTRPPGSVIGAHDGGRPRPAAGPRISIGRAVRDARPHGHASDRRRRRRPRACRSRPRRRTTGPGRRRGAAQAGEHGRRRLEAQGRRRHDQRIGAARHFDGDRRRHAGLQLQLRVLDVDDRRVGDDVLRRRRPAAGPARPAP